MILAPIHSGLLASAQQPGASDKPELCSVADLAVTNFVSSVLIGPGRLRGDLAMTDFVSSVAPFFSLIAWRTLQCRLVVDLRSSNSW